MVVAEVVNVVATEVVSNGSGKFGTGRIVIRVHTENDMSVTVYAGDLCVHSSYEGMSTCAICDYLHAEESADVGETMVDEVCAYFNCLATICVSGLDFVTHVDYPISYTEEGDCSTSRLDGSLSTTFDSDTENTVM